MQDPGPVYKFAMGGGVTPDGMATFLFSHHRFKRYFLIIRQSVNLNLLISVSVNEK